MQFNYFCESSVSPYLQDMEKYRPSTLSINPFGTAAEHYLRFFPENNFLCTSNGHMYYGDVLACSHAIPASACISDSK